MPSSNQSDFDGYHKWLGIPKSKSRSYYYILALSLDEEDHDVIRAAVEQRRHFVESKRGEGHDEVVAEILYQINEAEVTLLNEELRREYDRRIALFEKRRKNCQVDPMAISTRFKSRPGRVVGEENGFVATFAGLVGVICLAFAIMAWFSFRLPWQKQEEQPDPVPVAVEQPAASIPQQVAHEPVVLQPTQTPEPAKAAAKVPAAVQDAPIAPATPVREDAGVRVVITLPLSGDASIKVGRKSEIRLIEVTGEPATLPAATTASEIRKIDGNHAIEWEFQQVKDLSDFKVLDGDVHLDKTRGPLLFVPTDRGDGYFQAGLHWPSFLTLPMVISFDIDDIGKGGSLVLVLSRQSTSNMFGTTEFWLKADDSLTSPCKMSVRWDSNNGQTLKHLVPETKVSPDTVNETSFSLDKSELTSGNRFTVRFGVVGKSSVALSRLSLNARLLQADEISHFDQEVASVVKGKLRGTKWANSNNVSFVWTKDGRFLHGGKERQWELDGNRVKITFSSDHVDTLYFNASFTEFTQLVRGGPEKFRGKIVK